jgi:hypothetical protein
MTRTYVRTRTFDRDEAVLDLIDWRHWLTIEHLAQAWWLSPYSVCVLVTGGCIHPDEER